MSYPLGVDAVDKVGDEQRAGNNRIQVPSILNQCCVPDSDLESMLLIRPSKNVYRQHRPRADSPSTWLASICMKNLQQPYIEQMVEYWHAGI
jgi:hypothetical protein